MPRVRLTAARLQALKPGEIARDESVRGMFAECGPTGAVSLKVQADLRAEGRRQSIKSTLGRWPDLPLDEARARALALLAEVRAGRDPRAPAKASGDAGPWTVGRAFGRYIADLEKRPGTELSRRDMANRLDRYLADWRELPLASLTKELVEARQAQVAATIRATARQRNATGARTANAVVRDLGAVYEFARDYTPLPALSPTRRVTMIGEVRGHHEIPLAELGAWWSAVGYLKNPIRVSMHRLGLLSGLRPGNLLGIRREWIGDRRIDFPADVMKGRRPFTLPLSQQMGWYVHDALHVGKALYGSDCPWLFPRSKDAHVSVVRERAPALRDKTGHALRHTWKTCARKARLPESTIEILMAHRLGGVRDTYGSLEEQLDDLREAQEMVTRYILGQVNATAAHAAALIAPG